MIKKILLLTIITLFFSGCIVQKVEINESIPINITDTYNNDNSLNVNVQDYTGEAFSFFLTMATQYANLTQNANVEDFTIYVDNTTNCNLFDAIDIYDNQSYFQSLILSKNDTSITMNSELDRDFNANNTIIKCGEWDLSTSDGSTEEQIFYISPPDDVKWHMYSTAIKITDNLDWDLSKFGGGTALTNGISGRITDGYNKDLFLIYDNSGFILRGFEVSDFPKAPAGVYGLSAKLNFKENYGAVVELDGTTDDQWQAVNRDDLTSQTEIAITVNGHYTTE